MTDRKNKIDLPYGLDYCCHSTALYINNKLVTGDVRGYEINVLLALGFKDNELNEEQVDQDWIDSLGWVWPENLEDVKFNVER